MDLYVDQETKRNLFLQAIIDSDNPRKIIVAGPGTGKTYTFLRLFQSLPAGQKLALTFIRKLVDDMKKEFGEIADVYTFHAYCKLLLHRQFGTVFLVPYLDKIIKEDAESLGCYYPPFKDLFQNLKEDSPGIPYYLARGGYYQAVGFDDSVYKVYKSVLEGKLILPKYQQIVIDEYQDFNLLEVRFLDLLQEDNSILIVGDDDQAVYETRNASPNFLREKYSSGEYESFALPYCSRCPSPVVEATTAFLSNVIKSGGFKHRIDKSFVPYLEEKSEINNKYPKIIKGVMSNIRCTSMFISECIKRITDDEILESYNKHFPTVLIIGKKQFLNFIHKHLSPQYPAISYDHSENYDYILSDGYRFILENPDSNLGWRILAGCLLKKRLLIESLKESHRNRGVKEVLPLNFVDDQMELIELIKKNEFSEEVEQKFIKIIGDRTNEVINYFATKKEQEDIQIDSKAPTITLTSFEGCKGLSAGHVFIVGLNHTVFPKTNTVGEIEDREYRKFIVAMTRTRSRLYLLSNTYDELRNGQIFYPSEFLHIIPPDFIHNIGKTYAKSINKKIHEIFSIV